MHISPVLSPVVFFKSLLSSSSDYSDDVIQFSYARGALITAIETIKIKNNLDSYPTVWVPAFICDTVVDLLEIYSINYKYYHITRELCPDWRFVDDKEPKKGDIFLSVKYFGFSVCDSEIYNFIDRNSLFLIEDYAHSILDFTDLRSYVSKADAVIFGLRKALPLPHGGGLILKDSPPFIPANKSTDRGLYRNVSKMLIQWILVKLSFRVSKLSANKDVIGAHSENYYNFNFSSDMNSVSRRLLNVIDIGDVASARRKNYLYLYDRLANLDKIDVPKTLKIENNKTVPWVFYFLFKEADGLLSYLHDKGIPASYFPELHSTVFNNDEYRTENEMLQDTVTLPVHQDLSMNDLKFIADSVCDFIQTISYECYECYE